MIEDNLRELCKNCGKTFGAHHGGTTDKHPKDACPGTEGRMDWDNGPDTVFRSSGEFMDIREFNDIYRRRIIR